MENTAKRVHNRIHTSASDIVVKAIAIAIIGIVAIACLYPLLMVVSVSFSDNAIVAKKGYSVIPQGFTLDTYRYIFARSGTNIARSYIVTISITIIGTLCAMLVTSMISFSLSIRDLKYRNAISFFCNFTIIFSAGLIPWFIVCNNYYHMRDQYISLILPSMFSVWNMFLLRTYFSSVPTSLYESARLDGASWFHIWWKIALPLNKTAMLTVGMMYALNYWNEWWNALMFLDDRKKFPLQFILYNVMSNVNAISSGRIPSGAAANIKLPSETMKMAVTIITIGPIIFLYPFIQKYFVNGVMTGAVKE
ncbi:MAG: carbohydrate ABC transporter permease [Lachnospiraceae bacterium]|nr:carbohydrate ABC transporter permease [Lachnospiraceae bacterium]